MLELIGAAPVFLSGEKGRGTFGRSISSSAKLHEHFGALRMGLTIVGIRFETVKAKDWQASFNALTKGDKDITKKKAQDLFPELREKITLWNADALLLAE